MDEANKEKHLRDVAADPNQENLKDYFDKNKK